MVDAGIVSAVHFVCQMSHTQKTDQGEGGPIWPSATPDFVCHLVGREGSL